MQKFQLFLKKFWLFILILVIGISLKFYKLNHRYFWYDEICAIQHTSGIPVDQYVNLIPENEIKNISYYTNLLELKKQNYSLGSELKGLYTSANLDPLHYTFLMIWYRLVGDSPVHYRLFSVFFFLLTLPFLYLLTRNLFKSDLAGWIAVSLFSVSPFMHTYAQEARYYVFWVFFIIMIHYLFLRIIHERKNYLWILYALTGIFALYTSVLSGLILFGHLCFVWFFRKELRIKYSIALIIILIAYTPWIISIIENREEILYSLNWLKNEEERSAIKILLNPFIYIYRFFINIDGWPVYTLLYFELPRDQLDSLLFASVIIGIIITSIIYLFRKAPRETLYFLVCFILPNIVFFWVSDFLRNTWAGSSNRYQLNTLIGVLLIVTFFIYRKIESRKIIYYSVFLALAVTGIYSILNASKDRCFQIYTNCDACIKESELFSKAQKPLLITDYTMSSGLGAGDFMALTNECTSDNIYIMRASPGIENVEEMIAGSGYSEIYITHASDELIKNLRSQFGERMKLLKNESITTTWWIDLD